MIPCSRRVVIIFTGSHSSEVSLCTLSGMKKCVLIVLPLWLYMNEAIILNLKSAKIALMVYASYERQQQAVMGEVTSPER